MNYRCIYNVEAELSRGQKGTNSRDEGQGKRWEGRMRGKCSTHMNTKKFTVASGLGDGSVEKTLATHTQDLSSYPQKPWKWR